MITPAPLQTTYIQYEPVAQLGTVATMANFNVDARIADDVAGTGIGFGIAVCQGGTHGDKSVAVGETSGSVFVGITLADPTLPNLAGIVAGQFTDKYGDGDNCSVLTFGDVWVAPATAVAIGTQGYFNSVTGALGNSGISNAVAIAGSRWETHLPRPAGELTTSAGLATLRLGIMS
jgi:hypothetical protein